MVNQGENARRQWWLRIRADPRAERFAVVVARSFVEQS
jgi:hypothetical protein